MGQPHGAGIAGCPPLASDTDHRQRNTLLLWPRPPLPSSLPPDPGIPAVRSNPVLYLYLYLHASRITHHITTLLHSWRCVAKYMPTPRLIKPAQFTLVPTSALTPTIDSRDEIGLPSPAPIESAYWWRKKSRQAAMKGITPADLREENREIA